MHIQDLMLKATKLFTTQPSYYEVMIFYKSKGKPAYYKKKVLTKAPIILPIKFKPWKPPGNQRQGSNLKCQARLQFTEQLNARLKYWPKMSPIMSHCSHRASNYDSHVSFPIYKHAVCFANKLTKARRDPNVVIPMLFRHAYDASHDALCKLWTTPRELLCPQLLQCNTPARCTRLPLENSNGTTSLTTIAAQPRGVPRLDGARGKKQVWHPHVRT